MPDRPKNQQWSPSMEKPRNLKSRPNKDGSPRYYWIPSASLSTFWRQWRLPDEATAARCSNAHELYGAACIAAAAINDAVDAWRVTGIAPVDCPAFKSAHVATVTPRSLSALIVEYVASPDWAKLKPWTRVTYKRMFARLEAWAGADHVGTITRRAFDALMKELRDAGRPGIANKMAATLRMLLNYAVRLEWITANIARRPGITACKRTGRPMPVDAREMFIAVADDLGLHAVGSMIEVDSLLGQRMGDVIRFRRENYQGGVLMCTQRKTGVAMKLSLRKAPAVAARLDAELKRQRERGFIGRYLFLTEEGKAWAETHLRKQFNKVRDEVVARLLRGCGWAETERADGVEMRYTRKPRQRWWNETLALELKRAGKGPILAEAMAEQAHFDASFATEYSTVNDEDRSAFRVYAGEFWFQHMRHTAIVRMGEAGKNALQISAISGHDPSYVHQILKHYFRATVSMVDDIIGSVVEHERNKRPTDGAADVV